jgi:hypothetical protein
MKGGRSSDILLPAPLVPFILGLPLMSVIPFPSVSLTEAKRREGQDLKEEAQYGRDVSFSDLLFILCFPLSFFSLFL